MDTFISWSEERSREMAEVLREYLPNFIQMIKPWLSSEDISKGTIWLKELDENIEKAKVGILCITRENMNAPWLIFEAGALSRNVNVCPILLDVEKSDISGPLSLFQLTTIEEKDFFRFIKSLNDELPEENAISNDHLQKAFNKFFPELNEKLQEISDKEILEEPIRDDREILDEVLEIVRSQYRSYPKISLKDMGSQERDALMFGVSKGIERALKGSSDTRRVFTDGMVRGVGPGILKALRDDSSVRKSFTEGIIKGIGPGITKALRDDSNVRKSLSDGVGKGVGSGIAKALHDDSNVRKAFRIGIEKGSKDGIEKAMKDSSAVRESFRKGVGKK